MSLRLGALVPTIRALKHIRFSFVRHPDHVEQTFLSSNFANSIRRCSYNRGQPHERQLLTRFLWVSAIMTVGNPVTISNANLYGVRSYSLQRSWNLLGVQIQSDGGRARSMFLRHMLRL